MNRLFTILLILVIFEVCQYQVDANKFHKFGKKIWGKVKVEKQQQLSQQQQQHIVEDELKQSQRAFIHSQEEYETFRQMQPAYRKRNNNSNKKSNNSEQSELDLLEKSSGMKREIIC